MVTRWASGEPPPWMSEIVSALSRASFSASLYIFTLFSTGTLSTPFMYFFSKSPISGFCEIPVGRQVSYKAAARIDHEPRRLCHLFALMDLRRIGEDRVDEVGSGRLFLSFVGRSEATCIERFSPVDHVDYLLFQVTGLGSAVVIHQGECAADHAIDLAGLASAVALPVEGGKFHDHLLGKLSLTAHEDPLPGHEDVVEDQRRAILGVIERIADIAPSSSRISTSRPADHMDQSLRIRRNGKGNGVVRIPLAHGARGEHDDLVG